MKGGIHELFIFKVKICFKRQLSLSFVTVMSRQSALVKSLMELLQNTTQPTTIANQVRKHLQKNIARKVAFRTD